MGDTPAQGSRRESQLFIGGKWVEASGGTYDVVNPATEEVVGTAPNATVADAEAAAAAAKRHGPPGRRHLRKSAPPSWPAPPRPSRRAPTSCSRW